MASKNSTPNDFYVYRHLRKSDGTCFYIGKGRGNRAWSHHQRNRHWKFIANKHGVIVEIVQSGMQEWWAFELEIETIAQYDFERIANMSLGGEGPSGWVPSAEFRKNVSITQTGMKRSQETINKLREIARNRSPEVLKKISTALTGKPQPWNSGDKNAMRKPEVIAKRKGENHHYFGKSRPEISGERHWSYGKQREDMLGAKHFNAKPVLCVETGIVYPCIESATKWLKTIGHDKARSANIGLCCKGQRPRAYKLHWQYA